MPTYTLNFDSINTSAQVGDIVYYTHSSNNSGGFDVADLANTIKLGDITAISTTSIDVNSGFQTNPMVSGDFVSFAKDKQINTSSLVGYYASVKMVNNSTDKAELFTIGSEVSESSK